MWLIDVHNLMMKEFLEREIPPYMILSHRWEHAEIPFQDFELDKCRDKPSCRKVKRLCQIASDDVEWIWLDRWCIDKRNSTKLRGYKFFVQMVSELAILCGIPL